MSKTKLMFGLLIIATLITAGCTGTKSIVGKDQTTLSAGQSAALNDYKKYAGQLSDEIDYLKNHYTLPANVTLDQYKIWLDGFNDRLILSKDMYNNTSIAAKKYLGYLNNSSDDYKNVTAADAGFVNDLAALNLTYWQNADYFNMSVKKMAVMDDYRTKLNASMDAYNDLSAFAKGAKVDSLGAYSAFVSGFGSKTSIYDAKVKAAVAAGDEYMNYCDPGSAEYKAVQDNDNALLDNLNKCHDAYNNYKKDLDSKSGAQNAAQSIAQDYVDKVTKASNAKKDLDAYSGTAKAMDKLDQGWLSGYRQKIDAFDAACNSAIAAGNACKQYLAANSSDYKSIDTNQKNMQDSMKSYEDNYKQLETTFHNLHPLGAIM